MASKTLLCISVLYLVTMIRGDGNLLVGVFSESSKLLYHGDFEATGLWFFKRSETFDIKLTNGGKIKAIHIQDLRGDSSSWILAGGVGEDFATIKLESKRGSGYSFVVDVYGHSDDSNEIFEGNNAENSNEKSKEEGSNEADKEEVEAELGNEPYEPVSFDNEEPGPNNSNEVPPKEASHEEVNEGKSEEEAKFEEETEAKSEEAEQEMKSEEVEQNENVPVVVSNEESEEQKMTTSEEVHDY